MKNRLITTMAALAIPASVACAGGDAEAGSAIYQNVCGSCHYEDDFSGKSAEEVMARIKEMANPDAGHAFDLSSLSEQERSDIAAFFASGSE